MMMVLFLPPLPPSDACASSSAAARAHAPTAPQPAASPCSQSTGSAHSGCGTRSGAASWAPEPPSATRSRSSGPGTASPCEVSDTRRPREDGAPGTGPRSAATADLGTGPGGGAPPASIFRWGWLAVSVSVRADRATPEGLRPGRAKQPGAAEPLRPVGVEADLALPVEPLVLGRQAVPEAASRFVLLGAPGVSYVADPDPPPPEVSIPADRPPPHPPRPASWGNRSAHGHVCARKEVSRRFP